MDEKLGAGLKVILITCSILLKSLSERSRESVVARDVVLVAALRSLSMRCCCQPLLKLAFDQTAGLLSRFIEFQKSKRIFKSICAPVFGAMIKAFGDAGNVNQVRDLWTQPPAFGTEKLGERPSDVR